MKKKFLSIMAALLSAVLIAQEADTGMTGFDDNAQTARAWYTSPWVWVAGAAAAIALLVALTRGGSRRAE